jgi:site-specific DNA recombinase
MTSNREKCYATGDCRISSHKQQEGSSLEDQETQIRAYAKDKGLELLRVFSKVHSGREEDRADFEEVLDFIRVKKAEGIQTKYHIIKSIDRLTRNGAVVYLKMKNELKKLGTELVDVRGVIQPEQNTLEHLGFAYDWSWRSPTGSAQLAKAQEASEAVSDILTLMVGAEILLVQDGYKVRSPNDGFVNQREIRDGKKKVIEVPDPARAHFFRTMFDLRAEGVDDKEIVSRLNAMGFKTKPKNRWDKARKTIVGKSDGKELTVKQLQRFISRPIYAGIKIEKWTHNKPIRAQYDGLVTIDKFNLANRGKVFIKENSDGSFQLLSNYAQFGCTITRRLRDNPDFRYKFFPCPICRNPMLGSSSKGKSGKYFSAYHCGGFSSGPRAHEYIRIPKEKYELVISEFVASLKSEPMFLDSFERVLNDVYRTREQEVVSQSAAISLSVGDLKAQQASVISALITAQSPVVKKKLEETVDDLQKQIDSGEVQRNEIEVTEKDVKSFVRYVKAIMEHPAEILMKIEDFRVQKVLFGLLFETLPTHIEMANGTPKLSLAFKLSDEYERDKTQLVTLPGVEPGLPP